MSGSFNSVWRTVLTAIRETNDFKFSACGSNFSSNDYWTSYRVQGVISGPKGMKGHRLDSKILKTPLKTNETHKKESMNITFKLSVYDFSVIYCLVMLLFMPSSISEFPLKTVCVCVCVCCLPISVYTQIYTLNRPFNVVVNHNNVALLTKQHTNVSILFCVLKNHVMNLHIIGNVAKLLLVSLHLVSLAS